MACCLDYYIFSFLVTVHFSAEWPLREAPFLAVHTHTIKHREKYTPTALSDVGLQMTFVGGGTFEFRKSIKECLGSEKQKS